MYRHAAVLGHQTGTDQEAFREHWQTEHVSTASEVGAVRHLTTTPFSTGDVAGVDDLYFEDRDALDDALGGPGWDGHVDEFLAATERVRLVGRETVQFGPHAVDPDAAPYRRTVVLTRREDTTHEEFRDHWLDEHVPLVAAMPGVVRYTATLPVAPARAAVDGIADLYFDDRDAVLASMGRATDTHDPDHEAFVAVNEDATTFLALGALRQVAGEWTVRTDRTG